MKINELFQQSLCGINVGVERFCEALWLQEVQAVQVDFKPAAGGELRLQRILDQLAEL
ncbi:MAG: fdrA domain protein [Bacillota bacterium]|nr:fdrA domain protein [Bacillota bacterium]